MTCSVPSAKRPESTTLQDVDAHSGIGIAIREPDRGANAEVMKATMTDVQNAIKQLGRNDRDGAQNFSFSSTRDGDTDRETDAARGLTERSDSRVGIATLETSLPNKLCGKVMEAQAVTEPQEPQEVRLRTNAPPIDVEMSDESEDDDDPVLQLLRYLHFTRDNPHIAEEEEDARSTSVERSHRRKNSNETSSLILPKDDLSSSEEESRERNAQANRISFTSSPLPKSTHSPIPNDGRSPGPLPTLMTPDAIKIVVPVTVAPMDVHMIPATTFPEPTVQVSSVTCDIPAAHPSLALSASGTRQHSWQASQHDSVSFGEKGSGTPAPSALETEAEKKCTPPSEWTVDEVVEWLKSKGFGPDVYDRFIEQEVTGDVLLELDINLLKTEIGIAAFGKRMHIANAIAELGPPPSIVLTDRERAQPVTRSVSQSFTSMLTSMGSTLNRPPSSTLAGTGSLESPRAETLTSPFISKRMSSLSSTVASEHGSGSVEGISVAAGIEKAGLVGAAGLGLETLPETQLTSSPSDGALAAPEGKPEVAKGEEQGVQSEGETVPTKQHRRHLFGRSVESSGSGKDKERFNMPSDAKSPFPTGIASPLIERGESQDDTRAKGSADVRKGTTRHSLFGGTFTSSIGRSREPPPRVTSTLLEESSPTKKTRTSRLSRLYSSSKSPKRPSMPDVSTPSNLRNDMRSSSEGDDKREMERGNSVKMKDQGKAMSKRTADSNLVNWANSHLPRAHQMTDPAGPLFDGLALLRLAEDVMGKSPSPPIPDSAFPSGPDDDKVDGLSRLFHFLRDNHVRMGSVSINDVRQGKRDKVMKLLKAIKAWEDIRKEIMKSLGQGALQGPLQYCLLP